MPGGRTRGSPVLFSPSRSLGTFSLGVGLASLIGSEDMALDWVLERSGNVQVANR